MKNSVENAVQMVILDAIEKGHTNKEDLIAYMQSATFKAAVERYTTMLQGEFA